MIMFRLFNLVGIDKNGRASVILRDVRLPEIIKLLKEDRYDLSEINIHVNYHFDGEVKLK